MKTIVKEKENINKTSIVEIKEENSLKIKNKTILESYEKYFLIKEQISILEKQLEEQKKNIEKFMAKENVNKILDKDNKTIALYDIIVKNTLNTELLKKEQPKIYEKYAKENEYKYFKISKDRYNFLHSNNKE